MDDAPIGPLGRFARRAGKNWRSDPEERPSGWEDGRAKNGGLPKQTPELIPALKPLFWPLAVRLSLPASAPAWLSPSRRTPA